jgi:hypothetical protein
LRRLLVIGLVLVLVGVLLAAGFWPLTSVGGAQILAAHQGNEYVGYALGSRILIHEKVLTASYSSLLGFSTVEIEDGNPDVQTSFTVRGDARAAAPVGSYVYASAVLQQVLGLVYWEVATPGDIHLSWPLDAVFYLIAGLGVVLLVAAVLRRPARRSGR